MRSMGYMLETLDEVGQFCTALFEVSEHLVNFRTHAGPVQAAPHIVQSTCIRLLVMVETHQIQSQ
ncbi:hypothetical protein [Pseudomonas sp. CFBP 13719]|uniref:hypothetical protein n=1 Tax=Pseudomonas sp. CFBP 13719 TaxID=2775303 RepID=UPI00177AA96A|nr:hypothetical protein [Pseudomonas sp. CFBP 13719]MBD8682314.1 hypothetical protein [Pseudomonas sp. CFBP 13719]